MIDELLVLLGATLVLLSAVDVIRFPDVLSRLHALAKTSTLGMLLILGGAAINLRDLNDITSVALAGVLHLLASPPASNMISRAAYLAGGLRGEVIDEHPAPRRCVQRLILLGAVATRVWKHPRQERHLACTVRRNSATAEPETGVATAPGFHAHGRILRVEEAKASQNRQADSAAPPRTRTRAPPA